MVRLHHNNQFAFGQAFLPVWIVSPPIRLKKTFVLPDTKDGRKQALIPIERHVYQLFLQPLLPPRLHFSGAWIDNDHD